MVKFSGPSNRNVIAKKLTGFGFLAVVFNSMYVENGQTCHKSFIILYSEFVFWVWRCETFLNKSCQIIADSLWCTCAWPVWRGSLKLSSITSPYLQSPVCPCMARSLVCAAAVGRWGRLSKGPYLGSSAAFKWWRAELLPVPPHLGVFR